MSVRLMLAGLALVGLTACAAPVSSQSLPESQPSNAASYQDDPAASVKSYGATSKECAAASAVVRGSSEFATKADAGTATQDDFDAAYAGASSSDLPAEALPAVTDLKTTSQVVVRLGTGASAQQKTDFSLALSRFLNVALKICS